MLVSINLRTRFEVLSFTYSKDMTKAPKFNSGSRNRDHAPLLGILPPQSWHPCIKIWLLNLAVPESAWPSIVIMSLSFTVSEISRDNDRKSPILSYTPPVLGAAVKVIPLEFFQNLCQHQTKVAELLYDFVCVMILLFFGGKTPTCDWRTDGQTDRQRVTTYTALAQCRAITDENREHAT